MSIEAGLGMGKRTRKKIRVNTARGPAVGRLAPGLRGTIVVPSDLARQVERTVQQAKDLGELCREMLATLVLPVNADVQLGSHDMRAMTEKWKNRFFALRGAKEEDDGKD